MKAIDKAIEVEIPKHRAGLSLFPLAWTYAVLSAAAVSLVSVLAP